jgi:hypothetical protein
VRHDLHPVLAAPTAAEADAQIHSLMFAAFADKRTGDFTDSVESMCQVGG